MLVVSFIFTASGCRVARREEVHWDFFVLVRWMPVRMRREWARERRGNGFVLPVEKVPVKAEADD